MDRKSTGIKKLDEVMSGGYPAGKSVLINGSTGTGKTILSMQFAFNSCLNGEKCHYIITEEKKEDVYIQANTFGWDLAKFEEEGLLNIVELLPDRAAGAKLPNLMRFLEKQKIPKGDNLVLDNVSVFKIGEDIYSFREQTDRITYLLRENENTAIIVSDEITTENSMAAAAHSVHGVITLSRRTNPFTNVRERAMEIVKMRATPIPTSYIRYKITEQGVSIV